MGPYGVSQRMEVGLYIEAPTKAEAKRIMTGMEWVGRPIGSVPKEANITMLGRQWTRMSGMNPFTPNLRWEVGE